MAKKVPVSERALLARIDRALAKRGECIRRCREDSRWFRDLGRYYTFNGNNHLTGTHVDLEGYGRELGVLRAHEALVDESQVDDAAAEPVRGRT